MKNLILAHVLVCIFIFTMLAVTNPFLVFLFFFMTLMIYIYSGFITIIKDNKKIKYCILGLIGIIFFIASLIISPNQLPNKNIESSYVWTGMQLYLFPFEWPLFTIFPNFLKYPSFIERTGFYLIEIIIIGILPLLGALLREKFQPSKI